MVDTDDTRRTTDVGRRTTDDGRRTTPWVWHKLPTGELKNASQDADSFGTKYVCYNSLNTSGLNPPTPINPPPLMSYRPINEREIYELYC